MMTAKDPDEPTGLFMETFRKWAAVYCAEHNREAPPEDWFEKAPREIPSGLMESITIGLRDGTIGEMGGHQFVPEGSSGPKHYSWFSGFWKDRPNVWWEAFVHAAEFSRIKSLASKYANLGVGFEDQRMDITLYRDGRLYVCYEVKRKADDAEDLIRRVKSYGKKGITRDMPDRGNDPLRKAKYLAFPKADRPKYFSVLAIGMRREFSVSYEVADFLVKFDLRDDVIPIG